jgi:hypothetical protein
MTFCGRSAAAAQRTGRRVLQVVALAHVLAHIRAYIWSSAWRLMPMFSDIVMACWSRYLLTGFQMMKRSMVAAALLWGPKTGLAACCLATLASSDTSDTEAPTDSQ